jgi:hypothetical protein
MKICSICKLPKTEFYKNRHRPDGLQTYCKECAIARSKKRYKNFSEEQKQEIKDRTHRQALINKQYTWDFFKTHPCVDCGENDPVVLEFDHISNKKKSVANLANSGVSLDAVKQEIAKCEVRCANCHRRKTAKDFAWYKDIVL